MMIYALPEVISKEDAASAAAMARTGSPQLREAATDIRRALVEHQLFNLALVPREVTKANVRPAGSPAAEPAAESVDARVLIFLESGPAALCVNTGFGSVTLAAEAGTAVVLPLGNRVLTATDVLVAEVGVNSLVRDAARRDVLFDLASSLELVRVFNSEPNGTATRLEDALTLLRQMWE